MLIAKGVISLHAAPVLIEYALVRMASTAYENVKRRLYHDVDRSKYDLLPFVVETCGGVGEAARNFCKELRRRRAEKIFGEHTFSQTS